MQLRPRIDVLPPVPRSFLDLLNFMDEWTDLRVQTLRVLKANVRTAGHTAAAAKARADGRSIAIRREDVFLASVPLHPEFLNRYLFAFPAMTFGITQHCLDLSVSGLRRALRRVDLIDDYQPSTQLPSASAWRMFLDRFDDAYAQTALSSFAVWAHGQGISPTEVTSQTLVAFEKHVRTRTVRSEIPRLVRNVCKAWAKVPVLVKPTATLVAPSRRHSYTLRLDEFPISFQKDVDAFRATMVCSTQFSPFREDGPRPLRPRTVQHRVYGIRQLASVFVHMGTDISSLQRLSQLIQIDTAKDLLTFFWKRGQDTVVNPGAKSEGAASHQNTAQTGSLGATLIKIARYCRLDRQEPETVELH